MKVGILSPTCLFVLSEKRFYLISGNLLLSFPSPSNIPIQLTKIRPTLLTDIFAKIAEGLIAKCVVKGTQHSQNIFFQFGNTVIVFKLLAICWICLDVLFQGADKPKNIGTVVLTGFLQGLLIFYFCVIFFEYRCQHGSVTSIFL